jgi:hypothetical protein
LQCCDLAVRLAAARLRAIEPSLRFDGRVRAFARAQAEAMMSLLDDVTPCVAVYGDSHGHGHGHGQAPAALGTPVERPDEPVLCLTEARVHSKGHRGSRRVRGGGKSMWEKLCALLPYNPTWPGGFQPAHVSRPGMDVLMDDTAALAACGDEAFMLHLRDLQRDHSSSLVRIEYAPLPSATGAGASAPTAPAGGSGAGATAAAGTSHALAGSGIRVRDEPLTSVTMPYCIGCSRKVIVGGGSARGADAAAQAAAAAAQAPHAHTSWIRDTFFAILGISDSGSDVPGSAAAPAPAGSTGAAGKRGVLKRQSGAGAAGPGGSATFGSAGGDSSTGGDGTAVAMQVVTLGLCAGCWGRVHELSV